MGKKLLAQFEGLLKLSEKPYEKVLCCNFDKYEELSN
tara:strand:+ start:171 stop:281 length:111 start_codon:yes stop_codon:yes gene_type:complete